MQAVVAETLEAEGVTDELTEAPRVTLPTPDSVTVVLHVRAEYLFARSLPHGPRDTVVRGTATATAGRR